MSFLSGLGGIASVLNPVAAIGTVLGGGLDAYNSYQSTKQQGDYYDWLMNQPTANQELDNMSGGKYSSYLQNYAFATPSEQGTMARDQLDSTFPELNPWELAGTSSAGVASATGSNANAQAMEGAKQETQERIAKGQQATQLQSQMLQSRTQMMQSLIQGATSIATTKMNNSTSVDTANISSAPAMKEVNSKIAANYASVENMVSSAGRNRQEVILGAQKVASEVVNTSNLELTGEQIKLVNQRIAKEISMMDTTNSQVGKTATDVTNAIKMAIESVLNKQTGGSDVNVGSGAFDELKGMFKGFFGGDDNSYQGDNGKFGDDLPYVKGLQSQGSNRKSPHPRTYRRSFN